jgi:hypothetical protein
MRVNVVESERIELSSKQVTEELSTRLVFYWFSITGCQKTGYLLLIFLIFNGTSKRCTTYVNFYDASLLNAVNQGFQETFSFPT